MSFSPTRLFSPATRLISDLELAVRTDHLPDLASRIAVWPGMSRRLEPFAVTFAFVSDLTSSEKMKRFALRSLVFSPSLTTVISHMSKAEVKDLRILLRPRDGDLIPLGVAASCLADGVLIWKGQTLRDVLKTVFWADGLAVLTGALNRWYGPANLENDYNRNDPPEVTLFQILKQLAEVQKTDESKVKFHQASLEVYPKKI